MSQTCGKTFIIAKMEWLCLEAQEQRVNVDTQGWNTSKILTELADHMAEPKETLSLLEIFARVDEVKHK